MFGMLHCFNESHSFFGSTHLLCTDVVVAWLRIFILRVIVELVDFLDLPDVKDLLDLFVLVHDLGSDGEYYSIMEYLKQIMEHVKDLLLWLFLEELLPFSLLISPGKKVAYNERQENEGIHADPGKSWILSTKIGILCKEEVTPKTCVQPSRQVTDQKLPLAVADYGKTDHQW